MPGLRHPTPRPNVPAPPPARGMPPLAPARPGAQVHRPRDTPRALPPHLRARVRGSQRPARPVGSPTMVRDAILAAAERRSQALVDRDAEALRALHHPDLRWTTHRGEVRDRAAYIAGNTEGDLVWRSQSLSDADVVTAGTTAVLTAIVHDEYERAGEPGAHAMRLTLIWIDHEGTWQVLAGHAGPATA
jgi:hypothetical protein